MNDPTRLTLSIYISVRQPGNAGGGALELRDEITLSTRGFLEMAKVLGQFEELAQRLKQEASK